MKKSSFTFLLAIAAAVLGAPASAADGGGALHAFSPAPGDTSVLFLTQIFGPVMETLVAGANASGKTVFGSMVGIYCQAAFFLGTIFFGYTVYRTTIDTAADGVLLGQKMGNVYVPLRLVGGTALLLPGSSGYCLLQILTLWLASQAAGIASLAWNAGMDTLAVNGQLGYVSIPDARPLAVGILRAEVCAAAMNSQYQASGRQARIEFAADSIPIAFGGAPDINSQQYVTESVIDRGYSWVSTERVKNRDVCGSIRFTESSTKDASSTLRAPLLAAHSQAVRALIDELQPVAAKIVAYQPVPVGAIDAAVSRYQQTMNSAASAAIQRTPDIARSAFIQASKDAGWVGAGAWWASMTRMNDAVQSAVNSLPTVTAPTIDEYETADALTGFRDAQLILEEYSKDRSAAPRAEALGEGDWKSVRSADDLWRLLSRPSMIALDKLTHRIAGANTSPVTQLRSLGNDVISIGTAVKGVMFIGAGIMGAKDVDWTIGTVFSIKDALGTVTGTVEWLSSALWGLGLVLAYYLPAVPVIAFSTGVIRWLASVAEAVLAAPLMATFILHPDAGGHDVAGKSGSGWMILVGMTLQPILLLLGLILSILMTYPAGALVNELFLQMVSGAVGNDGLGLVGVVAWTGIYVLMMTLAMHSCFALIVAVPDNVMKYVAAVAGATGVVKSHDEAGQRFEGGAGGAGKGLGSGGIPKDPRNRDSSPGAAPENSISNAEHHSNRDLLGG